MASIGSKSKANVSIYNNFATLDQYWLYVTIVRGTLIVPRLIFCCNKFAVIHLITVPWVGGYQWLCLFLCVWWKWLISWFAIWYCANDARFSKYSSATKSFYVDDVNSFLVQFIGRNLKIAFCIMLLWRLHYVVKHFENWSIFYTWSWVQWLWVETVVLRY